MKGHGSVNPFFQGVKIFFAPPVIFFFVFPGACRIMARMFVSLLKSKLHHARVTGAEPEYEGSLSLDSGLMEAAGILPNEKLLVANLDNGNRFETYAIGAPRGGGACRLNGAAARMGGPGDRLIIMTFCQLTPGEAATHAPRVLRLDAQNRVAGPAS